MINKTTYKPDIDVFTSLYKAEQTYLCLCKDGLKDSDIEYICSIIVENIQRLRILKEGTKNL